MLAAAFLFVKLVLGPVYIVAILAVLGLVIHMYLRTRRLPKELRLLPVIYTLHDGLRNSKKDGMEVALERRAKVAECPMWLEFVGAWTVVIGDPDLALEVYRDRDVYAKFIAHFDRPSWSRIARFFGVNLVFSNGDTWRHFRSVLNPAFHFDYIRTFASSFSSVCETLVSVWSKKRPAYELQALIERDHEDTTGEVGAATGSDTFNPMSLQLYRKTPMAGLRRCLSTLVLF